MYCPTRHNTHPSAGVACIILTVYLMFTSLWPLSTLYFIWLVMDWQTPERGKVNAIIQVSLKTEVSSTYKLYLWTANTLITSRFCSVSHWRRDIGVYFNCQYVHCRRILASSTFKGLLVYILIVLTLSLFQCEHKSWDTANVGSCTLTAKTAYCIHLVSSVSKMSNVSISGQEDNLREEVEGMGAPQGLFSNQGKLHFVSFNTCVAFGLFIIWLIGTHGCDSDLMWLFISFPTKMHAKCYFFLSLNDIQSKRAWFLGWQQRLTAINNFILLCQFSCSVGEDSRAESQQELHLGLSSAWYHEYWSFYLPQHRQLWLRWDVSWGAANPGGTGRTFQDTALQGLHNEYRYLSHVRVLTSTISNT